MNVIAVFDPKSSFNSAKIKGTWSAHQCNLNSNTKIYIKLSGLKPDSKLGIHIHSFGDLTEGCKSLCDHYNPFNRFHGSIELFGSDRHVGDTCSNIISDKNGNVNFAYKDELVNLFGPQSIVGRSIVIHSKEDDLGKYRYENTKRGEGSRTTGNAGSRIACAVIGLSKDKICS